MQIGEVMELTGETRTMWKEIMLDYDDDDEDAKNATLAAFAASEDSAELFFTYSDTRKLREFFTDYGYLNPDDDKEDVAVADGATTVIGNGLIISFMAAVSFFF